MLLYSGLIISGGDPVDTAGRSVEVYAPSTGQQCRLADLPDVRRYHTMEAKTVCGGLKNEIYYDAENDDTLTSCITLTSAGTWKKTTNLREER